MSAINRSLTDFVPQDLRVVNIRTNLVPGYVTSRWSPKVPWNTGYAYGLGTCVAEVRNFDTNATNAVVQFQETADDSPSGTRTKLAAVAVPIGATARCTFTPQREFFEVKGIAGQGPIGIEIQTKIEWIERGFSPKYDTLYPQVLWAANPSAPVASAKQTFTSNTTWTVVHNLGYVATPTLISSTGVDITALGTISAATTSGYTVTFSGAQAGTAYSTQ